MTITPLSRTADLNLSRRAHSSLMYDNIIFVGDLIQKTREEILRTPLTGPKTLNEIESALAPHGLRLGVPALNWPPTNIEAALAA